MAMNARQFFTDEGVEANVVLKAIAENNKGN